MSSRKAVWSVASTVKWLCLSCLVLAGALWLVWMSQRAPSGAASVPVPARARAANVAPPAVRSTTPVEQAVMGFHSRSVWGRVLSRGRGLARASVCWASPPRGSDEAEECVETDAHGRFELAAESNPEWLLASAPGHVSRVIERSSFGSERGLEIELVSGGVIVSGFVQDATGGPVAGAVVAVRSHAGERPEASGFSDLAGRFELGMRAGPIELSARADGYSEVLLRVVAPTRELLLTLVPASEIVGQVVAADTSEPVVGVGVTAECSARCGSRRWSVRSDEAGRFRLEGLAAGDYELTASASEWRGEPRWVSVGVARASEPVLLAVSPATTLSVQVQRAGQACAEGYVALEGPTDSFNPLDAAGMARIEGLLPGRYEVTASCSQALAQTETIEIGAHPVTRRWQLEPGLGLRGRVLQHDGQPAAGIVVQVQPHGVPSGRPGTKCITNGAGEFSCFGLRAGQHACAPQRADTRWVEPVRVALSEEAAVEVLLRLPASAMVRVRVDPDVSAQTGGRDTAVIARAAGSMNFPIESTRQGEEFVFEHLALGRYQLHVGAPGNGPGEAEVALERHGQVEVLSLPAPARTFIAGRVLDAGGEPVVDVWVEAAPSETWFGPAFPSPRELTRDEGEFRLEGLRPGTYDLRVTGGSGTALLKGVRAGTDDNVLRWSVFASLDGRVEDAAGKPVSRFRISAQGSDGRGVELAGHDGRWQVPRLVPGQYAISVSAREGSAAESIALAAGERRTLVLQLTQER